MCHAMRIWRGCGPFDGQCRPNCRGDVIGTTRAVGLMAIQHESTFAGVLDKDPATIQFEDPLNYTKTYAVRPVCCVHSRLLVGSRVNWTGTEGGDQQIWTESAAFLCVTPPKAAGIDFITIANNHQFDFGWEGVSRTAGVQSMLSSSPLFSSPLLHTRVGTSCSALMFLVLALSRPRRGRYTTRRGRRDSGGGSAVSAASRAVSSLPVCWQPASFFEWHTRQAVQSTGWTLFRSPPSPPVLSEHLPERRGEYTEDDGAAD